MAAAHDGLLRAAALALTLFAGVPAAAQAVLDLEALPPLRPGGRAAYADWLASDFHRAFAVAADGRWGISSRAETPELAVAEALAACGSDGAPACRVIARDNGVVRDGRLEAPAPVQVAIGPFRTEPDHLYRGPATARGALVWSHGTGRSADTINMYLDPYVRRFSNAGWDVWRFDRTFGDDQLDRTTARLLDGARQLKQAGYARVIAAGHSRGGWQSLKALAEPGPLDGVIASAPAAHGTRARGAERMAKALSDFEALFAAAVPGRARVAVMLFADDMFDPDPPARVEAVRRHLGANRIPYLLIAAPPGFSGHWAAFEPAFDRRYGDCILHFFAADPPAAPGCD